MTEKTMTQKVLGAISDALWKEYPDTSAPEETVALISAVSIKVTNVICEDYNTKILDLNNNLAKALEANQQMLEVIKKLTKTD